MAQEWPPTYEHMLAALQEQHGQGMAAIRRFVAMLRLHEQHPGHLVEQAISDALDEGLTSPEGVRFCLDRLLDPTPDLSALDLSRHPQLAAVQTPPADLQRYDYLLAEVDHVSA